MLLGNEPHLPLPGYEIFNNITSGIACTHTACYWSKVNVMIGSPPTGGLTRHEYGLMQVEFDQ